MDTSSSQSQERRDKRWSSLAVTFTKPGDTTLLEHTVAFIAAFHLLATVIVKTTMIEEKP